MKTDIAEQTQPILLTMTIGDIVAKYPNTAPVLLGYGLHCVGCAVNPYETIEQGALGHGMDKEMIEDMIDELNLIITKKPDYPLNPEGITLSPRALDTLTAIQESDNKQGHGLKVKASKADTGMDFFLDLVEAPEEGDNTLIWEGMKIFIDKNSLELMKPSIVDYMRQLNGEGFKIISLKAEEETCPCGKPLSDCGCKNGDGCSCGTGGCC